MVLAVPTMSAPESVAAASTAATAGTVRPLLRAESLAARRNGTGSQPVFFVSSSMSRPVMKMKENTSATAPAITSPASQGAHKYWLSLPRRAIVAALEAAMQTAARMSSPKPMRVLHLDGVFAVRPDFRAESVACLATACAGTMAAIRPAATPNRISPRAGNHMMCSPVKKASPWDRTTSTTMAAPTLPKMAPMAPPASPSHKPLAVTVARTMELSAPDAANRARSRCCFLAPTANAAPAKRPTSKRASTPMSPPMSSF